MDLRFEGTLEDFKKILEEEVFENQKLLEEGEYVQGEEDGTNYDIDEINEVKK